MKETTASAAAAPARETLPMEGPALSARGRQLQDSHPWPELGHIVRSPWRLSLGMKWPLPGHAPPGRPVPGGGAGVGPPEEVVVAGGQAEAQPGEGVQCPGHAAVAGAAGGGPCGYEEAPASCPGAGPGEEEGPRGQEAAAAEKEEGAGEGLGAERVALVQLRGVGDERGRKGTEKERPEQAAWAHSALGNPASLSECLLGAVVGSGEKGFLWGGSCRWVRMGEFKHVLGSIGWSLVTFIVLLTPGVASVLSTGSGPSAPG